jgi:uncharacterized protein (DUF305 family)
MNTKIVVACVGAFVLGAVSVLAVGSFRHHDRAGYTDADARNEKDMEDRGGHSTHKMADGTMMDGASHQDDTNHNMMGMGDMMVGSEKEFLQHMIPHHEEAVATAKEVVARGGSTPEIKTLAQNIITAQEKEIAEMKVWYKSWYGTEYVADGEYKPMMRPLTELSGATLDKVFLTDMIVHHMGAIMMAESVESHIEHKEMTTLVANIKTTQTAEITQMKTLLESLPE